VYASLKEDKVYATGITYTDSLVYTTMTIVLHLAMYRFKQQKHYRRIRRLLYRARKVYVAGGNQYGELGLGNNTKRKVGDILPPLTA
jgi:alpha-tubulin suppressor-like RCC1 family protein